MYKLSQSMRRFSLSFLFPSPFSFLLCSLIYVFCVFHDSSFSCLFYPIEFPFDFGRGFKSFYNFPTTLWDHRNLLFPILIYIVHVIELVILGSFMTPAKRVKFLLAGYVRSCGFSWEANIYLLNISHTGHELYIYNYNQNI